MINATSEQIKVLSELFLERETELDLGRALSDDVKKLGVKIKNLFKKYRLEYCAHNAALLGSKRYAKYKFENFNEFVDRENYLRLIK